MEGAGKKDELLRDLFSTVDKNSDGVLSRYEWLRALTSPHLAQKVKDLKCFSDFNKVKNWQRMFLGSDGDVGIEVFLERQRGFGITEAERANEVMNNGHEVANDGDKNVQDNDERNGKNVPSPQGHAMEEPPPRSPTRRITKTLQNMDLDGDGKVSKEELTEGLKAAGIATGESLKQVKELYDRKNTGSKKEEKGFEIDELKNKISKLQALRDA